MSGVRDYISSLTRRSETWQRLPKKSTLKRESKATRKGASDERTAITKRLSPKSAFKVSTAKQTLMGLVREMNQATPIERVALERRRMRGPLVKEFATRMQIPAARFFRIIRVPKATAEKKAAADRMIDGAGGQAALGMVRLLGMTESILQNSTSAEAQSFDAAKWLRAWIERPQPALGGQRPAELLDTPTGFEIVSKVLGAIECGVYL